jgi:hypothetical protein
LFAAGPDHRVGVGLAGGVEVFGDVVVGQGPGDLIERVADGCSVQEH